MEEGNFAKQKRSASSVYITNLETFTSKIEKSNVPRQEHREASNFLSCNF